MSITTQVSFDKTREIQLARIFVKRPELAALGTSGAIYEMLWSAMDRIVPLEKTGTPEKGALEKTGAPEKGVLEKGALEKTGELK